MQCAGLKGRKFGVIGGGVPLAGAELVRLLAKLASARADAADFDAIYRQLPWRGEALDSSAWKLRIFDTIREFEKSGVTTVLLPSLTSAAFIDELRANARVQILDRGDAVQRVVVESFPDARCVGFLNADDTHARLPLTCVYPREQGIERGDVQAACESLVEQGAQIIVHDLDDDARGAVESAARGVPVIDANLAYALYAIEGRCAVPVQPIKVGVVGGIGPAATVDFLHKVVRNTPAVRDQDHIKMLVEQNPQIPDRTENLIGDGVDPTLSLYAACKRLEEGGADVIAMPCNTAHAFVERIQPHLGVPIVNMLTETARYLRTAFPALREVGVLATSGTIESGVYRQALESQGLREVAPDAALQARVMAAIYGKQGVKAGFTSGPCFDDIASALDGLIAEGVEVVILGCTELPLLLAGGAYQSASGARVTLIDPTDVLAKRCVAFARGETAEVATLYS
ncbi:amino acid racemase [Paraburkholderia tropica]|uniref:aspartate/glutamate racemase family protein n=1 Tax=Paraburkholderia tropica TaxID=92647 RepID=UPI0007EE1CB2|nr:amino acid racemase [Paraburkholderia tropica]OBR52625.1 aspartate racemase [Paraburkholderia tropica]